MGVGAGLYLYVVVVQEFTFAISFPDEFLLILGWVTTFGGQTTSVFHQATQANSASYPQRDEKSVPAKVRRFSAAGVKGRYGSLHLWINMWVAGKSV